MRSIADIPHPRLLASGTSQSERLMAALDTTSAKIDDRDPSDLLNFIFEFAGRINYYNEKLEVSDWQVFFEKSMPVILSRWHHYDHEGLQSNFKQLAGDSYSVPTVSDISQLFDFIEKELIIPLDQSHKILKEMSLPLGDKLNQKIISNARENVLDFIRLSNGSHKWYGSGSMHLDHMVVDSDWDIELSDMYAIDDSFRDIPGHRTQRFKGIIQSLKVIATPLFELMQMLSTQASDVLDDVLQNSTNQNHAPHLGLMLTFLKLFTHVQGDMNQLTKKHLEFFYNQVLCIQAKPTQADQAFIIFELQKHVEAYYLEQGVQLRDGKDLAQRDILFALDRGIVIDKAQITDVRTLYIQHQSGYFAEESTRKKEFVQGLYIAPNARSKDGLEEALDAGQSWDTLGNQFGKSFPVEVPPTIEPAAFPSARVGFVLESPVLFLNEGERAIKIALHCDVRILDCIDTPDLTTINFNYFKRKEYYLTYDALEEAGQKGISELTKNVLTDKIKNKDFFIRPSDLPNNESDKSIVDEVFELKRPFKLSLSTEDGWYVPRDWLNAEIEDADLGYTPIEYLAASSFPSMDLTISLVFNITLHPDEPAITFPDTGVLEEDLKADMPLAKIELDDLMKIRRSADALDPDCALQRCCPADNRFDISPYHFLRHLWIKDTQIEVEVCGVKDLIVQNDESVQDVNAPIYPFGARPNVATFDVVNTIPPTTQEHIGPNFYIGSQEIFRKKWDEVHVNVNWKNKPVDFNEYYKAYWVDPTDATNFGLDEEDFQVNISVLKNGVWIQERSHAIPSPPPANTVVNTVTNDHNRPLFKHDGSATFCNHVDPFDQTIFVSKDYFNNLDHFFCLKDEEVAKLEVGTLNGFLRINLQNQDFLHKNYSFVLARQMMAFGKLPDEHVEGAVYYDPASGGGPIVISTDSMLNALSNAGPIAQRVNLDVQQINGLAGGLGHDISPVDSGVIRDILRDANTPNAGDLSLNAGASSLDDTINTDIIAVLNSIKDFAAIIPNEPWTPLISHISLDYKATATVDDINLIHLYPFENTHKSENIETTPSLLPTHVDEGNLFVGLSEVTPGNNLNILFQLAESTAISETKTARVKWEYLKDNIWLPLHDGFHVIEDGTKGLSRSGIVRIKSPLDLDATGHTVMPEGQYWLRASAFRHTASVCETITVHSQAVASRYDAQPLNQRETMALESESISKLFLTDSHIKSVMQPYASFDGRMAEKDNLLYRRISETLRHKNRAIAVFDYERLILEQFPEILRAKSIGHTLALNATAFARDLEMAPGFVLIAVIPDIQKLSADLTAPRVPVSLLEDIKKYIGDKTSPFIRLNIENPRYEGVHIRVEVKMHTGFETTYFQNKLETEIRDFLAPWRTGDISSMQFGRSLYRADLIHFIECRDYIDYISCLHWRHADDKIEGCLDAPLRCQTKAIHPRTARSILIAGEVHVRPPLERPCESYAPGFEDCVKRFTTSCCEETKNNPKPTEPIPVEPSEPVIV